MEEWLGYTCNIHSALLALGTLVFYVELDVSFPRSQPSQKDIRHNLGHVLLSTVECQQAALQSRKDRAHVKVKTDGALPQNEREQGDPCYPSTPPRYKQSRIRICMDTELKNSIK